MRATFARCSVLKSCEHRIPARSFRPDSTLGLEEENVHQEKMKEADQRLSPLPENAAVDMDKVNYYYGTISRETAEWILCERGCKDGLYLLRKSKEDFVLSLCFEKR